MGDMHLKEGSRWTYFRALKIGPPTAYASYALTGGKIPSVATM